MRPWTFLAISGLLEVGWVVSLKFLHGGSRLVPLAGYALFGLGAAFFLSLSLREIPMGTAYAVWMGVSVLGTLCVDAVLLKQPYTVFRFLCTLGIVASILGLKVSQPR